MVVTKILYMSFSIYELIKVAANWLFIGSKFSLFMAFYKQNLKEKALNEQSAILRYLDIFLRYMNLNLTLAHFISIKTSCISQLNLHMENVQCVAQLKQFVKLIGQPLMTSSKT